MEKVLNQLVEKLRKAYGDRLVSVILYGSAAAGDHQAKFSDFNILCVVTAIAYGYNVMGRYHLSGPRAWVFDWAFRDEIVRYDQGNAQ